MLPNDSSSDYKTRLWELLNRYFILKYSDKIANVLHTSNNINYKYFEKFYSAFGTRKEFRMVFRPKFGSFEYYFQELRQAQEFYEGSGFDVFQPITYCDLTFPKSYYCEHGEEFKDVNIFFFSKSDDTENFIYQSLTKFNNLKSFI